MLISLILARCKGGGIGLDGALPWRLPADLKRFKSLTSNHCILMGRKTWESFKGKPLKGRIHLIVSRSFISDLPSNCYCFQSIDDAINFAKNSIKEPNLFIIGGAQIYEQTINLCDNIYSTAIYKNFKCDAFFDIDFNNSFILKSLEPKEENNIMFSFISWVRKDSLAQGAK